MSPATRTAPDLDAVRTAVESVPDPELPPVDIGHLGMLHDVAVHDDGHVEIELLPTFSGCPATEVIAEDIEAAVGAVDGVTEVTVRFRFDPPWTPDRIDAAGRERLREFGITPPGGPIRSAALDGLDERPVLPLTGGSGSEERRPCPYCGSSETERDSAFGPTPCRAIHYCRDCRQPFEAFKQWG